MGQARASVGKRHERMQTRITASEVLHHLPTTPCKVSLVWVVVRLVSSETGKMRIYGWWCGVRVWRWELGRGKRFGRVDKVGCRVFNGLHPGPADVVGKKRKQKR